MKIGPLTTQVQQRCFRPVLKIVVLISKTKQERRGAAAIFSLQLVFKVIVLGELLSMDNLAIEVKVESVLFVTYRPPNYSLIFIQEFSLSELISLRVIGHDKLIWNGDLNNNFDFKK